MNPSASNAPSDDLRDAEPAYSLEVIGEITGLSSQTIVRCRETGLLGSSEEQKSFSDETVRTLRRIEHLRSAFAMTDPALRLTLGLLDEIDRLHAALRAARR